MVMDSSDEPLEYVAVVCSTCGTRLHPEPEETERTITCPDCFVNLRVPSRAEAEARRASERRRLKPEQIEPYELTSRPRPRETRAEETTVTCPHCATPLTPLLERRERTILCPECFGEVLVPAGKDAAVPRKKSGRSRALREIEFAKEEQDPRGRPRRTLLDVQAEVRQEEIPEPPAWTFFSGVFDFPWRPDTISRWVWMSLGLLVVGLLGAYVESLAVAAFTEGDRAKGITLVFFLLPLIWLTFWTFSYTAACCIPVIMDTGNGNDRISAWPEANWREWMLQLMHVGFVVLVVEMVAMAVGRGTAGLFGSVWPGNLLMFFVVFPIVLLSSLEADSPWVPLSGPIMKSLVSHWWAWGVFYALAGALGAIWLGLFLAGVAWSPYLTMLVAAPLLAAMLLIDARLLGRVAWRASFDAGAEEEPESEEAQSRRARKEAARMRESSRPWVV
jgi:DNA-directed RNA polymerase subunit RPC12/RpoP